MGSEDHVTVSLVQQGVWDMPLESMPLASGYLKAMAMSDARLADRAEVAIHNFRGGVPLMTMATRLFRHGVPDVLAFSVFGWNHREFGALAETFKQRNPDGWVVFGGTHVANQAERTLRMFPEVDVVVNGEGEFVFTELLHAYLDGLDTCELSRIAGISFRGADGSVVQTAERERIQDLDRLPSPFLTGAIDLTDAQGRFRYDVALMETNRGCPYKCSFCYWGGAVGQRVRAFSRQRLRAELELFAEHQVHTIVLCDANFGMLASDRDFVADFIEVRDRHGFPRALETSWAKNKSKIFYDIVQTMKRNGLRSAFTLALQSLDDTALEQMNRRNMKVNSWEDLAEWLDREGLDCYAELIWGAPGETLDSFLRGYDRLSRHVSRIAVYPLHLLPNTEYSERRADFGIVSVRGDHDDFEYIIEHDTMSVADNESMKRFLFYSRVVCENAVLRHSWVGIRELSDLTQSQLLRELDRWVEAADDPAAAPLRTAAVAAIEGNSDVAYGDAIRYLFGDPEARRLLRRWWQEAVMPRIAAELRPLLEEIFRYDLLTQPVYGQAAEQDAAGELLRGSLRGEEYYTRTVDLDYDVPAILAALRAGREPRTAPAPTRVELYYRVGAENFIGSTNHEEVVHYMGMPAAEALAAAGGSATPEEITARLSRVSSA